MADSLTVSSRLFYERTKFKQGLSITLFGLGLMLLGFCSYSAGESDAYNTAAEMANDDTSEKSNGAAAAGYGFGSFAYIIASILLFAAGIYISPLCCGSANEKTMSKGPQELDAKSAV